VWIIGAMGWQNRKRLNSWTPKLRSIKCKLHHDLQLSIHGGVMENTLPDGNWVSLRVNGHLRHSTLRGSLVGRTCCWYPVYPGTYVS
jgi:hypothetical protein